MASGLFLSSEDSTSAYRPRLASPKGKCPLPILRVSLTARGSLPVFPYLQTCSESVAKLGVRSGSHLILPIAGSVQSSRAMSALVRITAASRTSREVRKPEHEQTHAAQQTRGLFPFEEVSKGLERAQPIRDDFQDSQHRNGQDRAKRPPHPEPEHQRQDDQHRIQREAPRKQHGRQCFALDEVNAKVEGRRQQRPP